MLGWLQIQTKTKYICATRQCAYFMGHSVRVFVSFQKIPPPPPPLSVPHQDRTTVCLDHPIHMMSRIGHMNYMYMILGRNMKLEHSPIFRGLALSTNWTLGFVQ